jgi:hypothetical protein
MTSHQYEFKTFDSTANNNNNKNEAWEYMDIMYEKSIEKFFDDLMDDQNGTTVSSNGNRNNSSNNSSININTNSVRPLGILDMNKHLTCAKSSNDSSKRLRIRLTDNKENIFEANAKKQTDKLIPNVYSPNSLIIESLNMKTNLSSSCSSPISFRDTNSSPFSVNKKHCQNTSVMLFRSVNNSHTICVEPTDVLEPLNEGDFAEYKLFPNYSNSDIKIPVQSQKSNSLKSLLEGLDKKASVASSYKQQHQHQSNEIHILTDYTPQSLSLSCSSASSLPSSLSNSPTNFIMQ